VQNGRSKTHVISILKKSWTRNQVNKNKSHWDTLGDNYSHAWEKKVKQWMSERELNFISDYFRKENMVVLDIGIGNGRILDYHVKSGYAKEIYGIDISEEMVKISQNRFKNNEHVRNLAVCDISREALPFHTKFDFITSIRVLKYNKNWTDIVNKCVAQLNPGGIFLFTMPNKYSINFFSRYHIPYYLTKKSELVMVAEKNDTAVLNIKSLTRIPDFLYELTNNFIYVTFLKLLELFLETLLGKTLFGRILFIVVKKK